MATEAAPMPETVTAKVSLTVSGSRLEADITSGDGAAIPVTTAVATFTPGSGAAPAKYLYQVDDTPAWWQPPRTP